MGRTDGLYFEYEKSRKPNHCKGCTERYRACWSTCPKYAEDEEVRNKIKQAKKEERDRNLSIKQPLQWRNKKRGIERDVD